MGAQGMRWRRSSGRTLGTWRAHRVHRGHTVGAQRARSGRMLLFMRQHPQLVYGYSARLLESDCECAAPFWCSVSVGAAATAFGHRPVNAGQVVDHECGLVALWKPRWSPLYMYGARRGAACHQGTGNIARHIRSTILSRMCPGLYLEALQS